MRVRAKPHGSAEQLRINLLKEQATSNRLYARRKPNRRIETLFEFENRSSQEICELSVEEAQVVLERFLEVEGEAFPKLKFGDIDLDYSKKSVVDAAHHIVGELNRSRFDEQETDIWFMRLGYYFGEALRQSNPNLSWRLGDPDYSDANQPCIVGFPNKDEAATIRICRNLIGAVVEGISGPERIDKGVEFWFDMASA